MDIGKQWRHIIESVQDGIIIVDAQGNFIAANQTAQLITGYKESELKGQSCRILHCNGCDIIGKGRGKEWCTLFSHGFIAEKKCIITNKHRRTIPIVKRATVLFNENNEIIG